MRPDSFVDFSATVYKLFVCLLNFLPPYFLILSSLLIYFLTHLLPDLSSFIYSFRNRPVPFTSGLIRSAFLVAL